MNNIFCNGTAVRTKSGKVGVVVGLDPYSPRLCVKEANGQSWYILAEDMKLESDPTPFTPKGFKHVGWMHTMEWVDGVGSPSFYGVDNKPKSWKESKNADLMEKIVVCETITPIFATES